MRLDRCELCPRRCAVDRTRGERGFCGAGDVIRIARAAPHFWEEPCISGTRGSGTVFFSHCTLRCVYCQNGEISHGGAGQDITPERLREIYRKLIEKGVHNINLVTPTHFMPLILPTLADLPVPVVMNCGGYERVETIREIQGSIRIYLPDFKYALPETAETYSAAGDYPETALGAIEEMIRQTGRPRFDEDGMLQSGVIIRHMILPNEIRNSLRVLETLAASFPRDAFLLSLMSQYTPAWKAKEIKRISRRITSSEYGRVLKKMEDLGFDRGYTQELSSAKEEYVPPFDGTGVRKE